MGNFEKYMERRSITVIASSERAMSRVLNSGTEERGFMPNEKTAVRRCPYCGVPFEVVLFDDKLHPQISLEKPKPADYEGDVIERIYDCPNPECRRPITVYYYRAKRFFV
jgi:hypothetical protein